MKAKSVFDGEKGKGRTIRPLDDAATVILLREGEAKPFEVFLMRRKLRQAFMGGAYVFPGGRLDTADRDPGLTACLESFSTADARSLLQEPDLAEATALGLFLAAIRETFEEAGVLLARDEAGRPLAAKRAAGLSPCRTEIHAGGLTLVALARRERLRYAPDLLLPYAHWITPEAEPRRFDTRFFLALLPPGQSALHDRQELSESRWLTPAAALAAQGAGRIALMPPTFKTLEELVLFPSLADLWAATGQARIRTILPEIFRTADGVGIRLPTDPGYAGHGERREPRPGETTRFLREDGIWKPQSAADQGA